MIDISTMSTATAFDIYGSATGTTYRPIFERVNTATVQYQTLTVSNLVGTNGGIAQIPVTLRYLQLRATAVVSGGVLLNAICVD